MSSLTKKMKMIAKKKLRASGKTRKRSLVAGSTPRFPVHTKNEPDAVLPKPPGSHPSEK
jgi:hypothetical protein